jgi:hypothetical protein
MAGMSMATTMTYYDVAPLIITLISVGKLLEIVARGRAGVQYLSIRSTERLEEAGAVRSVGTKGDSYDNALPRASTRSTRPSSFTEAVRGGPLTTSSGEPLCCCPQTGRFQTPESLRNPGRITTGGRNMDGREVISYIVVAAGNIVIAATGAAFIRKPSAKAAIGVAAAAYSFYAIKASPPAD